VPLNKKAKECIQKYLSERKIQSEYLFSTKTGSPIIVRNIRASMTRVFKRAGLNNVTVNDLRHTFTAFQLANGVSLETVRGVAGHKNIATTIKYLTYLKLQKSGNKETLEEL